MFLAAITVTAAADYSTERIAAWARPDQRNLADWDLAMSRRNSYVAVIEGAIAGFSDVSADGHVEMMFVSPQHARRGVGRKLLGTLEARAIDAGARRMSADVSITARPFFVRHGFLVAAEQHPVAAGVEMTNYRMIKPLKPLPERLRLPAGYLQPSGELPTLSWQSTAERLRTASCYWLATASRDGVPHTVPVWGVWVDHALYFDGIGTARWARNLLENPAAVAHLESAEQVVIVDGVVEDVTPGPELGAEIVAAHKIKYPAGPTPVPERGSYRLQPKSIKAWSLSRWPHDATLWRY